MYSSSTTPTTNPAEGGSVGGPRFGHKVTKVPPWCSLFTSTAAASANRRTHRGPTKQRTVTAPTTNPFVRKVEVRVAQELGIGLLKSLVLPVFIGCSGFCEQKDASRFNKTGEDVALDLVERLKKEARPQTIKAGSISRLKANQPVYSSNATLSLCLISWIWCPQSVPFVVSRHHLSPPNYLF